MYGVPYPPSAAVVAGYAPSLAPAQHSAASSSGGSPLGASAAGYLPRRSLGSAALSQGGLHTTVLQGIASAPGGPTPRVTSVGLNTAGSTSMPPIAIEGVDVQVASLSRDSSRVQSLQLPPPQPRPEVSTPKAVQAQQQQLLGPMMKPAAVAGPMTAPPTMIRLPPQTASPPRPEVQHKMVEDLLREVDELKKNAEFNETRALQQRLETSEQELSQQQLRSARLVSELDEQRSSSSAVEGQTEASLKIVELRQAMSELEQKNWQLVYTVESLERKREHSADLHERECKRLDHVDSVVRLNDVDNIKSPSNAATSAGVQLLRAELAERDRELRAAAAARRRCANQSERTAAALRAKLTELEAIIAATPTPSTSSRASSPRSSERGRDVSSPFAVSGVERSVQTETELGTPLRSSRSQDLPLLRKLGSVEVTEPQCNDDLGLWGTARIQLLTVELLKRYNSNACGLLSLKGGKLVSFLDDLFRLQGCSPPKLPPAILSTICNQVGIESSEGNAKGLSSDELCNLIKRVRKLSFSNGLHDLQRLGSDPIRRSAPASPKGSLEIRALHPCCGWTVAIPPNISTHAIGPPAPTTRTTPGPAVAVATVVTPGASSTAVAANVERRRLH
mmetsp:Transcript_3629/g.7079  ORF Transcript_3629/g.7079 Transcript_3629/m.7079 type:complete len:622 (+) Transcript_3629:81-1946(+)